MKSALITLSWLCLLVACDAWFLNLKSDNADKMSKVTPAATKRKVILVARKVYVPMYVSDDTVTPYDSDRLLPVSPVLATSGAVTEAQQQRPVDYPSMYYQPPVATYAMSSLGSAGVSPMYSAPSGYASPVPVFVNSDAALQYNIYPDGYGAAGPQYVQYANTPSATEPWVMEYVGSEPVPAGPDSSTVTELETATQESEAPVEPVEVYPSV